MTMTTATTAMTAKNNKPRHAKTCSVCGKTFRYLSKHLLKKHKMTDAAERHHVCLNTPRYQMSKRELALYVANMPFKKDEMKQFWKMKNALKRYLETDELDEGLDNILTAALKRYL